MAEEQGVIEIRGARQNHLRNLDLDIRLHAFTVITGVSGSGKSSLAFDTIYAEGQRRYVETFSPYARQFLERMDKPAVDRITGIPPAVAIDQTNPVRTSRSTVGTMTELNDHLKLLFARTGRLVCGGCGEEVRQEAPEDVARTLLRQWPEGTRIHVLFSVSVPAGYPPGEVRAALERQGYSRIREVSEREWQVVQDRLVLLRRNRGRLVEAIETAYKHGHERVILASENGESLRFSGGLHCATCDRDYREPVPNLFSFNSAVGACTTCRGFGRTIGIDMGLVVPDEARSLGDGAIRPWQSGVSRECQRDLVKAAKRCDIPLDVPWRDLPPEARRWVVEGDGRWEDGHWYGIDGYFQWMESKSYKMHIRVMLSKYRAYHTCPACKGARLNEEALRWRIGPEAGLNMHEVQLLPLSDCRSFFAALPVPRHQAEAILPLLGEIRSRLRFLCEAGLGYLTLDRQSRTLSGGEVQRINLTTALGTTLVNTLFVLDEPTIRLHPRDTARMIGILHRLRDAGNTLLVVEHDPDLIRAADEVIDLGPGAGADGGAILYQGTGSALPACRDSLTAACLRGENPMQVPKPWLPSPAPDGGWLTLRGAAENNLKGIDVSFPLGRLVCVTGVSGSGKSTLLETCLYRGLLRTRGESTETPGVYSGLEGGEAFTRIVYIDQHPLGKTTRSNPASYTGAWEAIRTIFAREPLSVERGYKPGTFSFNSGKRCEACGGNGFQRIEMQFLSDVFLRCEACHGRRFQDELLDVTITVPGREVPVHVADVLEMTVDEAAEAFGEDAKVKRALEPLARAGLGYLRLGQPVPTLSGGEAQRLKLASYLQESGQEGPTLFLFDEPTTGLHLADVGILLQALRALVSQGHTVLVIEHHLDVIRESDWIVDLGPDGGAAGGSVVCAGPPDVVAQCAGSHTGAALREGGAVRSRKGEVRETGDSAPPRDNRIRIQGAREHNLKGIDLAIPRDTFTVITGLSGSGKSTVAFDILYQEGQRRYLDSLNAYARQFVQPASRPDVDAVIGVPPTVAIEQRISRGGLKSTVATITEIYHFLRLLFARLGEQMCPDCDLPIEATIVDAMVARVLARTRGKPISVWAPLVRGRKGIYKDLARKWEKRGVTHLRVDGELASVLDWPDLDRYREHDIDLPVGALPARAAGARARLEALLREGLEQGQGVVRVATSGRAGAAPSEETFSVSRACSGCGRSFPEMDPRLFSFHSRHGWCPSCSGTGLSIRGFDSEQTGEEEAWLAAGGDEHKPCPACGGTRLRVDALAVRVQGMTIDGYTAQTVEASLATFSRMVWGGNQQQIAESLQREIVERLRFLDEIGLRYLTLDRAAPTLSGGEAQRIRLAAQLGSNLRGVCYVLDEPTIGLHPYDNHLLLESLRRLQQKGNTVVVVEHDEDTIRQADHVIDLGPGAGVAGGIVTAAGSPASVMENPASVTGRYLREPLVHPVRGERRRCRESDTAWLHIQGADKHNLKGIQAKFPLGRLVCVTGVSGSGKSTLVRDVLVGSIRAALAARKARRRPVLSGCSALEGMDPIQRVDEVDQTPIGRTPRSCPATYVGLWDDVRALFASTPDARMRAYGPDRFSFNTGEGRCPACKGTGHQTVEMSFLPNVSVTCDTCNGRRYTQETCQVRYQGKSIADVLAMSVDEAVPVFTAHPAIDRALRLLQDVGLGYLDLGQRSPTLSGGEAQRIKLVSELARGKTIQHTLYVLDEPSVGLHMGDVGNLVHVLHRLVDAGHSVMLIEHNLDLIAEADYVIDLGPGGGAAGGKIVGQGSPERIVQLKRSLTGACLAPILDR